MKVRIFSGLGRGSHSKSRHHAQGEEAAGREEERVWVPGSLCLAQLMTHFREYPCPIAEPTIQCCTWKPHLELSEWHAS